MLNPNLKIYLAVLAAIFAVVVLFADRNIAQGTGLIVATLAAGAGWLVRDVIDGQRTLITMCQAYAALVEAHFEEVSACFSDEELARHLQLAIAIANGDEPETVSPKGVDPFSLLPDVRGNLHLLSPETVRYLWKWQARGRDMFAIYDLLGTMALSAVGHVRLEAHFSWIKQYRDEYRDIGYTALRYLAKDAPNLKINFCKHEQAGAKLVSTDM